MRIAEPLSLVAIKVLSASNDSGLNGARAMLLRDHGFDVTTSEDAEHAIREIKQRELDVLIFGSTLPRDNCWTLAEIFRQHHSKGKIIEILPSPWAAPKNRPDVVATSLKAFWPQFAKPERDCAANPPRLRVLPVEDLC